MAGERRRQARQTVPLVHLKLLVLGDLIHTDEHPEGFVVDYRTFLPRRVWLGSANLTWNSRRSLELGVWTQDQRLAEQAKDFLVELLAYSEPIDGDATNPAPEFHEVEFDDDAMREAAAAMFGSDAEDDG